MITIKKIFTNTARTALFSFTCVAILSCTPTVDKELDRLRDVIDPNIGMTREEFKNNLTPEKKTEKDDKKHSGSYSGKGLEPAIPEVSNILTTPMQPEAIPDKLISLSVTDDVPLKDVLIELSRLADIDMEIDPKISGGIILRIKNKPFKEVIERVVNLAGLRYKLENGVMRVERDTSYKHDYKVDFLNMVRTTDSSINIDTQSLGGDTKLPSGSTSSTTSTTDGNVWLSVEEAIRNMLDFTQESGMGSGNSSYEVSTPQSTSMQINRQAGIISVIATERQHKSISEYLASVAEQVSSQVLIEAKVVEVTLAEEYRSGVDWGTLTDQRLGLTVASNFAGGIGAASDFLTIGGGVDGDLKSAISFTEAFGVARTLSSPRLHAMNNQPAVLSFAENSVYFDINVEEQTDNDGVSSTTSVNIESEAKTIPVGVILTLQPSINMQTREITMHVRPTLSRITTTVQDPGIDIIIARQDTQNPIDVASNIPVVEVREMDSVLKIKSGQIMVIGGLMKDKQTNDDKGVPFLNRIPFAGNMFKSKVQTSEVVETIIFIKATIVDNGGVSKEDQNVYEKFVPKDPRPLAF